MGLVFIALGLSLVVPGCSARLVHSRLQKEGVVVEGTVTGKRSKKSHTWSGRWIVDYSFVTRDNRFIEGSDRTGGGEWLTLRFAGPVTVAYLPSRPETNRVLPLADGGGRLQAGLAVVGAGLVLLVMTAFRWPGRVFAP
ncbi:MAG TPA: DUF3592 domain-containing protein [Vicinamibacteria bacterium]|nr:DUF3592 domain-containing protein [Vicinamibacteria bacterium]